MERDENLCLQVIIEEISTEVQAPARTKTGMHELEGLHREESSLAMSALRPGVGK